MSWECIHLEVTADEELTSHGCGVGSVVGMEKVVWSVIEGEVVIVVVAVEGKMGNGQGQAARFCSPRQPFNPTSPPKS